MGLRFSPLIEATLDATASSRLDEFLRESRPERALLLWLTEGSLGADDRLVSRLMRDIAEIDRRINAQVNAILHHPSFQRLEASWRSLDELAESVPHDAKVKLRVLSVRWTEIAKDMERAIEFDQSALFRKVYTAEFGQAGGEPFGLLLGDYMLSHRPRADQPVDDLRTLAGVASVATAAFAPFVASAHPSLIGLNSFSELERYVDLHRTFRGADYAGWRALRENEETRFVGLTLPAVLMREPYAYDPERADGFRFTEEASEHGHYLWGNACFSFGKVAIRAFARWGWLADIRGTQRDEETGGLVGGMHAPDYGTDAPGVARRFCTEAFLTDRVERELSDLGFIPLAALQGEEAAVFYSTASVHSPATFDTEDANLNARLSSLLHYILCCSRVAHFVKVICRDMTGSVTTPREIQRRIKDWLMTITASTDTSSDEIKARFPLSDCDVSVRELPGRPGCFDSVIHLCPHFQLDQMTSSMRLVTEIATTR